MQCSTPSLDDAACALGILANVSDCLRLASVTVSEPLPAKIAVGAIESLLAITQSVWNGMLRLCVSATANCNASSSKIGFSFGIAIQRAHLMGARLGSVLRVRHEIGALVVSGGFGIQSGISAGDSQDLG